MSSVHVVAGLMAADTLRAVLSRAAPRDRIIAFCDPLNVGPLGDIDGACAQREAFWEEVYDVRGRGAPIGSNYRSEWKEHDEERAAEDGAWEQLLSSVEPVVVWHGPHPREFLLALRVSALLNGSGREVYEVVRRRKRCGGPQCACLPTFYDAVGIAGPEELAPLVSTRTAVTDPGARAEEWTRVCAAKGMCFRDLTDDGAIIGLREDGHDERLINNCSRDWQRIPLVIGTTMADTPVGPVVLAWRLRKLVSAGVLEVRGKGPFGPEEVRRSSRLLVRLPRGPTRTR